MAGDVDIHEHPLVFHEEDATSWISLVLALRGPLFLYRAVSKGPAGRGTFAQSQCTQLRP